jgi:REP element-mobilizing transposase RayT
MKRNLAAKKYKLKYRLEIYSRASLNVFSYQLKEAFKYVAENSHIILYRLDIEDHRVILELSFPPCYSIDQTVYRLKEATKNYLYKNKVISKRIWSSGYFCKTVDFV